MRDIKSTEIDRIEQNNLNSFLKMHKDIYWHFQSVHLIIASPPEKSRATSSRKGFTGIWERPM